MPFGFGAAPPCRAGLLICIRCIHGASNSSPFFTPILPLVLPHLLALISPGLPGVSYERVTYGVIIGSVRCLLDTMLCMK